MNGRGTGKRWHKGQSGNPNGRPRIDRTLAQALQQVGQRDNGPEHSNVVALAEMIWGGVINGKVGLEDGRLLDLGVREWLELVKWLHTHLDGTVQGAAQANQANAGSQTNESDERLAGKVVFQRVGYDWYQVLDSYQADRQAAQDEEEDDAAEALSDGRPHLPSGYGYPVDD